LKDGISASVRELVLPVIEKLRLSEAPAEYLDLLEKRVRGIADKCGIKISQVTSMLSPRETEICTLIQSGLTSKEIANLLGVSYQTVEKHRRNIRKKIGLSGKKINLTSYLQNKC
jgi:DNA-binding CsgD family transcriptional regulator